MPLFQYFGWAGSFLIAALLAANWCCSAPISPAPHSDVPLDQKINIRIHTDHKWPERVVFDTTRSTLAREATADPETDVGRSETPVQAERNFRRVRRDSCLRQALFSTTLLRWPSCGPGR